MNAGKTVFSQLMDFVCHSEFQKCVHRYRGDYKVKDFSCLDQFFSMSFAQLTYRESLRDLVDCLEAKAGCLYHMGIRTQPTRNNLANANAKRDWQIYHDFAMVLIAKARALYGMEKIPDLDLREVIYALDSSTIDLCLSLFPWAQFRRTKAAIKLHTLYDIRCQVPAFIHISNGKLHDVNVLDILVIELGAFYIMDRGYVDFLRIFRIHQERAFFVTRAKANLDYRCIGSRPVDRTTGLRADQTIRLCGAKTRTFYPEALRRISYRDPDTERRLIFLTNNFTLPATVIAALYKKRWQVELFFKWIKQHLRIKAFYGTSANAVKTQIWIAISVYVLVAIVKKRLGLDVTLYQFLQVLSLTLFEKTPISIVVSDVRLQTEDTPPANQLELFDL
jgi:hypothetical protein